MTVPVTIVLTITDDEAARFKGGDSGIADSLRARLTEFYDDDINPVVPTVTLVMVNGDDA